MDGPLPQTRALFAGDQSLLEALYAERRALVGCFVILMGTALFSATAMHMAEGRVQPDKLGTIPDAFWWAIVTLGNGCRPRGS